MLLKPGTVIGRYKIIGRIGAGAWAEVYKAKDLSQKRIVAVKCFNPTLDFDDTGKMRFVQEADLISKLKHENICTFYEVNETPQGSMYIAMSYYTGGTLQKRIHAGTLTIEDSLRIAIQIARGVSSAHRLNLIHRDIKPLNILFSAEGVVKIVDFGIAKCIGLPPLTSPGMVLGTIAYMSPEQAEGQEINHQTDIWALGVVFYEMLTGTKPFAGKNEEQVYDAILSDDPRPLREVKGDIPVTVERATMRALSKPLDQRYPDIDTFLADLEKLAREFSR